MSTSKKPNDIGSMSEFPEAPVKRREKVVRGRGIIIIVFREMD